MTTCGKIFIGVSGSSTQSLSVRAMMQEIKAAGAVPIFLSSARTPRAAISSMAQIHALVLMGNNLDIDPQRYLQRYPEGDPKRRIHPETKSEMSLPKSRVRALYEEALLAGALAARMPVLGICGGMQRLNVMCGGTLHQHIPDLVGSNKHMQHKQGIAPHIPVVPIIIKDDTLLASIASAISMPFVRGRSPHCAKVIMENSMHHQSVDKIGAALRVSALTDTVQMADGTCGYLAEALEADPEGVYGRQFILGVQWHPEFGASSLGESIVRHMVAAARQFSRHPACHRAKKRLAFPAAHSILASRYGQTEAS